MRPDWIRADWPAPTGIVAGTTLRGSDGDSLPLAGRPCRLEQVHGIVVVPARDYAHPPAADASVSNDEASICVVRTADCLPVLFCSTDGNAFAAAHAGWRGLAAGVLENTVAAMAVEPQCLMAWLGPAISQPAFEVGSEVRKAFVSRSAAAAACFEPNARGRWQADLYGLARQRLNALGVSAVYGGGFCTYRDEERFFSYRRDPECGRMTSFIGRN